MKYQHLDFMACPARRQLGLAAAIALTAALTGCAGFGGIAPQAKLQDPQALDAGPLLQSAGGDAAWPDERWWQRYGDPQLDALVDAALAGG